ncbi:uncharacterized protein KY384_007675 [Bacidia gigantensis]|uniref:uncharacterized protein n=1 Tax=Bacidia gigantensis TaxID=2732470 RepID=UPI001D03CB80|nr:uncharacterized protein KY384_007675 [Bacidia gigantensis]KAG8527523.1 hypothetical protein KY384_007675 [Bacidia gigantensis]
MQLAFFDARHSPLKGPPKCFRGLTIIKVGGDLSKSRLQGAVGPEEVLDERRGQGQEATFLEVDPREGFSVRNFHIQVAKTAVVSDIVVYGDCSTQPEQIQDLAKKVAFAQSTWRVKDRFVDDDDAPEFNTFILSDTFEEIEKSHPELVAIGADGQIAEHTLDFFSLERQEMCTMSKATEISHNVWLGPTPDTTVCQLNGDESSAFDILIEASDLASPHDAQNLRRIGEESYLTQQNIDFPSSGSIIPQTCPKTGLDPLTRMCQWIHKLANRTEYAQDSEDALAADSNGDIQMRNLLPTERKILIHCTDGYTETTLLSLAYFMYAEQLPVHEAWLRLHCEKERNFFAYASDVTLLTSLEPNLIHQGRPNSRRARMAPAPESPAWLSRMDGSLPSRILPYLYLGNLGHANNPELLKAIGITQILSIGEPINWTTSQIECWGTKNLENVMYVDRVQDNGVDPLMPDFQRCLKFIGTL